MSYEDAANTIRGRFKTLIADGESVDVQYDNAEYDPGDEVWVRCTIRPGSSEQVSTGGTTRRFRNSGLLIAEVFTPIGVGESYELIDTILDSFRAVTVSGVKFKTPYPMVLGRVESGIK